MNLLPISSPRWNPAPILLRRPPPISRPTVPAKTRCFLDPSVSRPQIVPTGSVAAASRPSTCDLRARALGFRRTPELGLSSLNNELESVLDTVKWDEKGLAVAIAQNLDTGAILMQGFANREALSKTISSRKATFFSRSRSSLWTKGETSMNFINVHDIFLDCDRDSIIYLGKPDGPTCHTGAETCYYSSIHDLQENTEPSPNRLALTTLYTLESTISKRKDEIEAGLEEKPSWTKRLLLDPELLCSKIREEAEELSRTLLDDEDSSRTASEMADLLYHAMVLLRVKGAKMEDVIEALRNRFSQSGIEEKNSR